jgi:hypothetical protein
MGSVAGSLFFGLTRFSRDISRVFRRRLRCLLGLSRRSNPHHHKRQEGRQRVVQGHHSIVRFWLPL